MNFNQKWNQYETTVLIAKGNPRKALIYLPANFSKFPNTTYPLIITHPGSGEVSIANNNAGIANLVRNGIPKMIADGWKPIVENPITKEGVEFIVLSVQQNSTGYIIPPSGMKYALDNCTEIAGRYRKDAVFITGLSLGGCCTAAFCSDQGEENLDWVTALMPLSAKALSGSTFSASVLKKVDKPVWQLCGSGDAKQFIELFNLMKQNVPGIESTLYPGGHDGWINQYRNARTSKGYNFLQWFMSCVPSGLPENKIENVTFSGTSVRMEGAKIEESCYMVLPTGDRIEYIVNK